MYDRLVINMRQKIKNIYRTMLHQNYTKKELVEQASTGYITEAVLKHILVNLLLKLQFRMIHVYHLLNHTV